LKTSSINRLNSVYKVSGDSTTTNRQTPINVIIHLPP